MNGLQPFMSMCSVDFYLQRFANSCQQFLPIYWESPNLLGAGNWESCKKRLNLSGTMRKHFFLSFLPATIGCLLVALSSFSQTVLPPDQPEQDACNALSLCGNIFSTPYSYQGTGKMVDINTTLCGAGEANSMWMKVTIVNNGALVFSIIPKAPLDDYDFAVLDVTGADCKNLSSASVVRCNFNNNYPGSNVNGVVGLSLSGTETSVPGGYTGNSFCKFIDAKAGQTYLIMINNFGDYQSGGASAGFTIDFSGSTATFDNSTSPALGSVVKLCSDSSVTVELTKPVLCSSIAADGSDFYITPFVAISGATGMNCVNGNGYTSQVTIHFSGLAPIGKYVLHTRQGTDGNTLVDFCNNTLNTQLLSASLSFIVPPPAPVRFLPADTVKCFYSTIPISPLNEFTSYQWSTGETTPVIHVIDPGPYTLMATDSNGCVGIDSIVIKDSTCPEYIYLPSAFTPNADGRNDLFRPKFAGAVIHFRFSIYDRWGRKVFESSDPGRGWDGSIGGKTLPAGTYVWVCAYRLFKRPEEVQKGTVMLVR